MAQPYEIIRCPFDVYVAPVGESWPDLADTPAGNWVKLGTSGTRSHADEGVVVQHSQTVDVFRGSGATGPQKAWRTEEDLIVRFTLVDLTLEQYKHALDGVTVSTTAAGSGTAGYKSITLYQGRDVTQYALLVKGAASSYGDDWSSQYQVPVAIEEGSPKDVSFSKGAEAGLALQFRALEDPNASTEAERFGKLLIQNDDPT